jgi:hypothetical protein
MTYEATKMFAIRKMKTQFTNKNKQKYACFTHRHISEACGAATSFPESLLLSSGRHPGHVPPRFWEVNLIVTVRGVGEERV